MNGSTLAPPPPRTARACPLCGGERGRRMASGSEGISFLRCSGCGLAYWQDLWDEQQVQEHYHGYYGPEAALGDPITRRRYEGILARMERIRPPGQILDVGCGAGHFLATAESWGWKGTGLEVSRSALNLLDLLKRRRNLQFQVMEATLEEADLPEASFDAVTGFEVLEHLNEPAAFLRRAASLLKEGGLLYLTTPNLGSLSRRLLGARWRVIAQEHRCLFTPSSMRSALRKAGLRPLRISTRNIDLPEILTKSFRPAAYRHPVDKESGSQRLRRRVEAVAWLRFLKSLANRGLFLTGLGDTLEAFARRVP